MPIEIKELHIRVAVNPSENGNAPANQSATQPAASGGDLADKEAVVAECVEQVLQILQEKRER